MKINSKSQKIVIGVLGLPELSNGSVTTQKPTPQSRIPWRRRCCCNPSPTKEGTINEFVRNRCQTDIAVGTMRLLISLVAQNDILPKPLMTVMPMVRKH
jgi:hypothetical protein